MKCLVIDDDFDSRRLLQKILNPYAMVDVATDGEEAVQAFRTAHKENDPYQLITLDLFYLILFNLVKKVPKKVTKNDAEVVILGSMEGSNHRQINKMLVNSVVETCQLQMGMTELKPGSVWNTMPAHTHDRRMEAYLYFHVADDARVVHLMGQPEETRHLIVADEQAVISPSWSIHSGVGTRAYSFVWAMAGENQDFDDMDHRTITQLR